MPSDAYEFAECCPDGYTEINSIEDCESAYGVLASDGEYWGGVAPRDIRPSGCYVWTPSKKK